MLNRIILQVLACLVLSTSLVVAGEIQVITEHTPILVYTDENGRVTGPMAEVVHEMMGRLYLSGGIKIYPWKLAYKMALNEPQTALFATTRTRERENLFKWVGPIIIVRWGLFAKQGSSIKINSLEDAKKVGPICEYLGDAKVAFLKGQDFTNLQTPVKASNCLGMLKKDYAAVWLTSDVGMSILKKEIKEKSMQLDLVYAIGTKYLYIALSKDIPDSIVSYWQRTLDNMKADGTVAKLYKWYLPEETIKAICVPEQPEFPWKTKKQNVKE